VDALADSFPSSSSYNYAVNNPISIIDPDGRDTLLMHVAFNEDKSTKQTAVFDVSFSLISNGSETVIELEDAMSMISNKEEDERGTDNSLRSKELYKLTYDQLSDHNGEEGWENTIRVTSSGVFIHPGEDYFWFGGCKGVTCNLETSEGNEPKTEKSESISALQKIRDLYDEQCNLTGNKFLLKPNSRAYDVTPVAPNQTVKKYKP